MAYSSRWRWRIAQAAHRLPGSFRVQRLCQTGELRPARCPAEEANLGHFSSQCALLSEAQMVRLGGLTAAHNARLRSDELQMIFVANSSRCTQQESCFVSYGQKLVTA